MKRLNLRKLGTSVSPLPASMFVYAFGMILIFQNCSGFNKFLNGSSAVNLSSVATLLITPAAVTVAPQTTYQFKAGGGNSSSYKFSVVGTGSIDPTTGIYTAAATPNDDIVRLTDSSGSAAYSFVKVAAAGSSVGLNPGALMIGFQSSYQFIATGGTPPFTYTVTPANYGTIDSASGIFTSANASGSATVTATDANGSFAYSLVTIQQGVETVAPIYAPNPLSFGQVATFYLSDVTGANLLLQSGPGATSGLSYTPGYQTGPALLQLSEGSTQIPVQIPLSFAAGSGTCVHGKQIFTYTGADQTFTLPSGCPSATVKMWGGGGAGGGIGGEGKFPGGGGGFVSGTLSSTETQNIGTLTVIVGSGGSTDNTGPGVYGGGGASTNGYGHNSGAGRSAIRIGTVEILTAGGGGGGFYQAPNPQNFNTPDEGVGGAGGGLVSEPGSCGPCEDSAGIGKFFNGGSATQTAGGSSYSGFGTGTQFQGGGSGWGNPSGGGGYFGGGGAGTGNIGAGNNTGGGGGGSSYIGGGGIQSVYNGTTIGGSGATPGNTSDPDYITGIGWGGGSAADDLVTTLSTAGGNGLVIIQW